MTQYNTLNVNCLIHNSKLKSGVKNGIGIISNFSSKGIVSSNGETNFPHKLL